ncbi:MAG: CreA family protein [Pyramidobacter sp.]|nr:CreA family protein [Pyramidobacter sp.]
MRKIIAAVLFLSAVLALPAAAREDRWEIGSVDTAFKLIGPNHKIMVEAFRDPDFPSIVCYVSYAKAGGVSGALGLAEDPARFSLAIEKTDSAPLTIEKRHKRETQVFTSRSALFRKMKVVRFYDDQTEAFVYVAASTVLLDGSPYNAIAVIPTK